MPKYFPNAIQQYCSMLAGPNPLHYVWFPLHTAIIQVT